MPKEKQKNANKTKKIAGYLVAVPIPLLVVTMIAWSVILNIADLAESSEALWLVVVNFILGFLGIISVLGIMIAMPIGVILLLRKGGMEAQTQEVKDQKTGETREDMVAPTEVPEEIKGWNWGAAGFTVIWGIYFGVWWSLLVLIPYVGTIVWIILAIKGNEWAWQAGKYKSVEEFQTAQKKWRIPGMIAFIAVLILNIYIIFA